MDLSNFSLVSATFEARYDPAFLLWDSTGRFWHALRQAYPALKMIQVSPSKVSGSISGDTQLALETERFAVDAYYPPAEAKMFLDVCNDWLERVVDQLAITVFKRVGMRLVFRRDYRTREDAASALLALGLLKVPDGKHFGISGAVKGPQYAIRWEGDTLGMQVNIRTQDRKLLIEPPVGERAIERVEKEFFELDFDVDYYTMQPVAVGQIRVRDWMQQTMRVIRRDSGVFLGE